MRGSQPSLLVPVLGITWKETTLGSDSSVPLGGLRSLVASRAGSWVWAEWREKRGYRSAHKSSGRTWHYLLSWVLVVGDPGLTSRFHLDPFQG